jgi:hypothetical protein
MRRAALHTRIFSVGFAVLGPSTGNSIVAIEPIALIFYLGVVALAYAIGREALGARSGLLAAATVAVWPSMLLHSTQPLRDTLFLANFLLLVYAGSMLASYGGTARRALAAGAIGSTGCVLLWLGRVAAWPFVGFVAAASALLCLARQAVARRAAPAEIVAAAVLLAAPVVVPRLLDFPYVERTVGNRSLVLVSTNRELPGRLNFVRSTFLRSDDVGSAIDAGVVFGSHADVVAYAPRAFQIGYLAPFPTMWVGSGAMMGSGGRALAGLEMLVVYALTPFAVYCVWRERRRYTTWLLAVSVVVGATALGLAIPNVGALYRQRFDVWALLFVLAAGGVERALTARRARRAAR